MIEESSEKEARLATAESSGDDVQFELTLRPQNFGDYIGQKSIKDNLSIIIEAAKGRSESIEHLLFFGNPGLGKTSLARVISNEIGKPLRITSGPAIEKPGDLAAILSNLSEGEILFIDEIHRLNSTVEEMLYPAMEDYALDIILGKGPAARTIRLDLPKFTLIGATTKTGMISSPLRDRFGATFRLEFYSPNEIRDIVKRSASILKIDIDSDSANEIASRSRQTPRIANRLLKRVRDYAQVKGDGKINKELTLQALKLLDIDSLGLDTVDRKILLSLVEKFSGGPVGLTTLAAATSEESDTIEDVHEPFLLQLGFLERTPRGRKATVRCYEYLGLKAPQNQQNNLV